MIMQKQNAKHFSSNSCVGSLYIHVRQEANRNKHTGLTKAFEKHLENDTYLYLTVCEWTHYWESTMLEDIVDIKVTASILSFSPSCKLQRNSLNGVNDCYEHDNVTDNKTMYRDACL